jgi:hypothetical protein
MLPADAIARFIESMGRHAETEFWLKLFRAEAKERFATLAIEPQVLEHAFDAVVVDLRFLSLLGLTPVVTLGVYDHGDTETQVQKLHQGLLRAGVTAQIFAFQASYFQEIKEATRKSCIPIVAFTNDQRDRIELLGDLLNQLQVAKLIYLNKSGAVLHEGSPVSNINLTTEFDSWKNSPELSPQERDWIVLSRHLIFDLVQHKLLISVTSPLDLLRELFTVKGAGTMLRQGAVIQIKNSFDEIDEQRLRKLLQLSFGRAARDDFFSRPISRIYLEENYRGAALMMDTNLGGYLSKFAVERQAQGEGIGRDIWVTMLNYHPTLFWRSRPHNPINAWYMKEADGFMRQHAWHIFWKGLEPQNIPAAIAYALAQPDDMGLD